MLQSSQDRVLTYSAITDYALHLQEEEKSSATVQKYVHDLNAAVDYFSGSELTKVGLIKWKNELID